MRRALVIASLATFLTPAVGQADEGVEFLGVFVAGARIPAGVAVDPAGNVYVAELSGHRVRKFSPAGEQLAMWRDFPETGPFREPSDVAVDRDGRVWVADRANNRIVWLTTEGEYLGHFGSGDREELSTPNGIGLHPSKPLLYVADTFNGRVRVFDITRNETNEIRLVADYASHGTEPGQLFRPTDIAIASDGEIFVIEPQLYRFQIFSPDGHFRVAKGNPGTAPGLFGLPVGITLDRNDDIYVVDSFNRRIQKFTRDLNFVCEWGTPIGARVGPLNTPLRMAITEDGLAYICDTPSENLVNRVVLYQLDLPTPVQRATWSDIRALYRGR